MNKYVEWVTIDDLKVLYIDFSKGLSEIEYMKALDEAIDLVRGKTNVNVIIDMTDTHTTLRVVNYAAFEGKQVARCFKNIVAINPSTRQHIFLQLYEHMTGKNIHIVTSKEEAIERIRNKPAIQVVVSL